MAPPHAAERALRLAGWICLALLLVWALVLPNSIGAGASVSPFLNASMTYIALLLPLLLGLNWLQARMLSPDAVRPTTDRLASLELIQAVINVLLLAQAYPGDGQVPTAAWLNLVILLILIQLPGLLLLKGLLLKRLGLWQARPGLMALGLELLVLCAFWLICVLPVPLNQTYWLEGRVKSRMHGLQTMIEIYAVDWGGLFPQDLTALEAEARVVGKEYWKAPGAQLCEPYTLGQALADHLQGQVSVRIGQAIDGRSHQTPAPCGILYLPSPGLTRYFLYGYDAKGRQLREHQRLIFFTNS